MTPQEVKKAIQNGKEVFFDDVSYPWFSMIKDRLDTATYKVVKDSVIATLSAGYADGIFRRLSDNLVFYDGNTPCKSVGRISMDLITVDISHLDKIPNTLSFIGPHQSIDQVATLANTIGHEVLTSIGTRYNRVYK